MVKKILGSNPANVEDDSTDPIGIQEAISQEMRNKCQITPIGSSIIPNGKSENADEEMFLFDPEVIDEIDLSRAECKFNPEISSTSNPSDGFKVRPLSSRDYDRGFLEILGQLTSVGHITKQHFLEQFDEMRRSPRTYYITVIVDTKLDKIVGSGTLVREKKFIHQCGARGLVEDIIVDDSYRGKQLGKILLATLVEIGKAVGCYKITLNCKDELVRFYNSFGLVKESGNANFMVMRVPT